jgi:adenosyl cobinamide kinase/adenosyl cobinamide phosphate guanylyltransferase
VREVAAELIGAGHRDAWRYRWRFFVTAARAAGERLDAEMRLRAAAHRASRMDEKSWRGWVRPSAAAERSHREIYEQMKERR